MTDNARILLARMLRETGLSQHAFARLIGASEKTVNQHVNHGVIPLVMAEWYHNVIEIRTQPGNAVIILGMPSTTPVGEYRRTRLKT